ncbi:hypothetical protein MKZ38_009925 [Zalerion maritima]|uniref:Uncharacterized protein n=1 Tax=Zalerion maritima TaxID=339359 RepID=A0AAD5WVG1_9PEZI|nr:hypothetical protein MKZ38_009925 [Zalerion maritima]
MAPLPTTNIGAALPWLANVTTNATGTFYEISLPCPLSHAPGVVTHVQNTSSLPPLPQNPPVVTLNSEQFNTINSTRLDKYTPDWCRLPRSFLSTLPGAESRGGLVNVCYDNWSMGRGACLALGCMIAAAIMFVLFLKCLKKSHKRREKESQEAIEMEEMETGRAKGKAPSSVEERVEAGEVEETEHPRHAGKRADSSQQNG